MYKNLTQEKRLSRKEWGMFLVLKVLLFIMTVLCAFAVAGFIGEGIWLGTLVFTCFTICIGKIFLDALAYKETDES